jgi:hypothetical protein
MDISGMVASAMQAASNAAARGRQRQEKEDPIEKENRATYRKAAQLAADNNDIKTLKALEPYLVNSKIDPGVYFAQARIETEDDKRRREQDETASKLLQMIVPQIFGTTEKRVPETSFAPQPSPTQGPILSSPAPRPILEQGKPPNLELKGINYTANGGISFNLGPRKVKTINEIAEENLSDTEREAALQMAKDKKQGKDLKTIEIVKDQLTGFTNMYGFDRMGRLISETQIKSDYSGEEKRKQAQELKQTTSTTGVSEVTGKPIVTTFSPSSGVNIYEGETKVAQTAGEKAEEAKKQKLTQMDVRVDKDGYLTVTPIVGGEVQASQRGAKVEKGEEPKDVNAEETKRITDFRTVYDSVLDVEKFVDEENLLKEYGVTIEELTGPVAGRVQELLTKLTANPAFERLKTKLGKLRPIVYALSGKAINESENKWLDEVLIPEIKQNPVNLLARLEEFRDWVKRNRIAIAAGLAEQGKRVPLSSDLKDDIKDYLKTAGSIMPGDVINDMDREADAIIKEFGGK